jgi:hypothetical protein
MDITLMPFAAGIEGVVCASSLVLRVSGGGSGSERRGRNVVLRGLRVVLIAWIVRTCGLFLWVALAGERLPAIARLFRFLGKARRPGETEVR